MKSFRLLILTTLFASIAIVTPSAHAAANPDGSFSHSIPIAIPPGTNGVAPKLSLVYNSHGGNGVAGVGWDLAGLPVITRINYGDGINYDGTDTYVGPCGRLVSMGDGTYHCANEAWIKFIPSGQCGPVAGEYCYWNMYDGSGHKLVFGYTASSQIVAPGRNGSIRVWAMNSFEDANGNSYNVEYTQYISTGDYYPLSISYTKGHGISKFRTVEFTYELRPDHGPIFAQNTMVDANHRLKWITIRSDMVLVRKYRLDYETGTATQRSRLVSVVEFGSDGASSLPEQRLIWQEGGSGWDALSHYLGDHVTDTAAANRIKASDVNGDGKTDFIYITWNAVAQMTVLTKLSNGDGTWSVASQFLGDGVNDTAAATRIRMGDVNGDGKSDIIYITYNASNQMTVRTKFSNGNGTWTAASQFLGDGIDDTTAASHIKLGDVNGDGRTDIIYITWDASYRLTVRTKLSNGDGTWTPVSQFLGDGGNATVAANRIWTGDVNGDGRTDIIYLVGSALEVRTKLSNGDGTWTGKSQYQGDAMSDTIAGYRTKLGDFNGDGKTDFILTNWDAQSRLVVSMKLSNGDGTWTAASQYLGDGMTNVIALYRIKMGDFNHDGKTDFIYITWNAQSQLIVNTKFSNGDGTWRATSDLIGDYMTDAIATNRIRTDDVTGDGKTDVIYFAGTYLDVRTKSPSGPQPDLLTSIQNGVGGVTSITYAPAPQIINADGTQPVMPTGTCIGGFATGYGQPCGIANSLPRAIVTRTTVLDGRGGSYSTLYTYSNGRYFPGTVEDAANLGFQKITVTNEQTGSSQITVYNQDKPYAGHIYSASDYASNGNLLVQTLNGHNYTLLGSCGPLGCTVGSAAYPRMIVNTSSRSDNYDPISSLRLSYVQSDTSHDAFGNVIILGTYFYNGSGALMDQKHSYASYINDLSRLMPLFPVVGLKKESKVCTDSACGAVLAHNRVYYDNGAHGTIGSNGTTTGLATTTESIVGGVSYFTNNQFDVFGNGISTTFPNGTTTSTGYDASLPAMAISSTDALGNVSTVNTWDDRFGIPTNETTPNGLIRETMLNEFGLPTQELIKDSGGIVLRKQTVSMIIGDANSTFIEKCTWNGAISYCGREYSDALGRVYKKTSVGEGGTLTELTEFDAEGRVHRESDPFYGAPAYYTRYVYGADDRAIQTIRETAFGSVVSSVSKFYNDAALVPGSISVQTTVAPNGGMTRVWRDHLLREIQVTEGVGTASETTTQFQYNARGDLSARIDPTGNVTSFTYDDHGRIVSQTVPGMGTTTFVYYATIGSGSLGKPASITRPDPNGGAGAITTDYTYDPYGRQLRATSSDGSMLDFVYGTAAPNRGQVVRTEYTSDGYTLTKEYGYSPLGYISQSVFTLKQGITQLYSYNTSSQMDALGRPESVTYPGGSVVSLTYTPASGKLDEIRLSGITGFMGKYFYNDLDPRGQVQSISYANGATAYYTYRTDTGALNTARAVSNGINLIDVSYGYDAGGNVTTLTDSVNTNLSMSYTYDALNRLRTASRADLTNFAYDFNAAGNLTNNNGTAQVFGTDNRLASSGTESFAWSADGTMTSRTNSANGATVAYGWDNATRMKSVAVNGVEKERNYYDESGERFLKIYTQDSTTQVKTYYLGGVMEIREKWVSGVRDTSQTTRYIAGKDGQRLASITDWDAGKNPLMALNSASYPGTQLALAGMTSVTGVTSFIKKLNHLYNGYMAQEGFRNRITTIAWMALLLLAFLFIQLRVIMGIRIFGVVAERTDFGHRHPVMASLLFPIVILFSGTFGCSNPNDGPGFLSALFTTKGSYPGSYYNGDGLLVGGPRALLSGDTTMGLPVGTYFYHSDHLGSSSVVTDATGAVTTRIHYLPYGQVDHPNSPGLDSVTYKFTGQEYDPEAGTDPNSGLYNYGARFFDPKLGIFISADTVHGGGLSQGMNRWMYVGGNPINYVDPSGHSWLSAMTNGLLWAVNNVGPTISGWTSGAVAGYDRAARGLSGTANWASAGIGGVYWGSQPYVDAIKGGYNEICDRLDDGDDDQNSHHSEAWNRENTLRLGGLRAMELGGWEGYLLQQASMAINVLLHVYHIPVSIALSYTYDDGYGAGVSYGPEEGSLSGGVHWQEKGAAAGWSVNVGFTYNFLDKDGKPAGGSMGLFASYHQKGLRSYGLSAGMQGKSGALGFRMVQSCMAGGTCSTAIQGFGMPNVATLIGKLNTLPEQVGDQNQLSGRRPTEVTFYKGGPHTTGLNGLTNGLGAFFAGETGPIMSFLDTFFTHPLSVIHDWMWTQGTPGWLFAIGNLPTFVPAYQIGNAIAASDYISTIGADCFTGGGSHCF